MGIGIVLYVVDCWLTFEEWNTWSVGAKIIFNTCSCDWEKIHDYSTTRMHYSLHSRNARSTPSLHAIYTHLTRVWHEVTHSGYEIACYLTRNPSSISHWVRVMTTKHQPYSVSLWRRTASPPDLYPSAYPLKKYIFLCCFMIIFARIAWPNTIKLGKA